LVHRVCEFSNLHPWQWTPAEIGSVFRSSAGGDGGLARSTLRGYQVSLRSAQRPRSCPELPAGQAWRSVAATAILVTGIGGAGKTHLLCDLARTRAGNGLPTILALGKHFEHGPIEADLGRIIGFHGLAGRLLAGRRSRF
jgi:hypothetical protein